MADADDAFSGPSDELRHAEFEGGTSEPQGGDVAQPIYERSPKHGSQRIGRIGAAPRDGQLALDRSLQVKPSSTRRVGVDLVNEEIVVFDEHLPGRFHGHVRSWHELTPEMRQALIGANLMDRRGNIREQR